ncbi:MAG: glycosyltransferase [Amnibacterium sp.]
MSTAVIVTVGLGGNLPPMLGIGAELAERGWTVVAHTEELVRAQAEASGFAFERADGVAYDAARNRTTIATLREIPAFWADRTRGRDAVALARRVGADVVLVDVLLVGALAELVAAGIPAVAVAHSTWEGVRGWLGGPIGALLRMRGVDPLRTLGSAARVLVASSDRLGRNAPLPPNAAVVGPVLEERPAPAVHPQRPVVLAALSTVAFPGQREALQRLLDAVATLPVDAHAGTGRSVDPAGLRVGANTRLTPLVDHRALLPEASVVVSHGGHATTVRALAHGVPMLFLPMHPMMDQPRIARAVAAAGAGLVLPRTASRDRIRAALARLLEEPSFGAAARRLSADLVAAEGRRRAADEVERVAAGQSRPVRLQASSESSPEGSSK